MPIQASLLVVRLTSFQAALLISLLRDRFYWRIAFSHGSGIPTRAHEQMQYLSIWSILINYFQNSVNSTLTLGSQRRLLCRFRVGTAGNIPGRWGLENLSFRCRALLALQVGLHLRNAVFKEVNLHSSKLSHHSPIIQMVCYRFSKTSALTRFSR